MSRAVNMTWNEVLLAQTSSSQRLPSSHLFHDDRQNTATPQRHQLMRGGRWIPLWCIPRQSVAVIVPFRDRDQHLNTFINHLHPFLRSQLLDFIIIVVEQVCLTCRSVTSAVFFVLPLALLLANLNGIVRVFGATEPKCMSVIISHQQTYSECATFLEILDRDRLTL